MRQMVGRHDVAAQGKGRSPHLRYFFFLRLLFSLLRAGRLARVLGTSNQSGGNQVPGRHLHEHIEENKIRECLAGYDLNWESRIFFTTSFVGLIRVFEQKKNRSQIAALILAWLSHNLVVAVGNPPCAYCQIGLFLPLRPVANSQGYLQIVTSQGHCQWYGYLNLFYVRNALLAVLLFPFPFFFLRFLLFSTTDSSHPQRNRGRKKKHHFLKVKAASVRSLFCLFLKSAYFRLYTFIYIYSKWS